MLRPLFDYDFDSWHSEVLGEGDRGKQRAEDRNKAQDSSEDYELWIDNAVEEMSSDVRARGHCLRNWMAPMKAATLSFRLRGCRITTILLFRQLRHLHHLRQSLCPHTLKITPQYLMHFSCFAQSAAKISQSERNNLMYKGVQHGQ
jgi:hypothetical protein